MVGGRSVHQTAQFIPTHRRHPLDSSACSKPVLSLYAHLSVWATLPSRESTGPQVKGINMENAPWPKHFRPGESTTYQLGRMSMTFKTTAGEGWNAYPFVKRSSRPEPARATIAT